MTDTPNLTLPCIEDSQAQKHITHNDALRILDTLVQLAVLDRDLSAPPGSPGDGERWIVKPTGTGAWAGHDNTVAAWQDGAWIFSAPQTGWLAYIVDEGALVAWSGSAWIDAIAALTSLNNMTLLGVGTTADATNPFSAKLNNTLFTAKTVAEGGDGDLRYKLSKEAAANTLSFLFQDNFSGRAEIGLTGDDDFHFKVSADGAAWHEGIVVNRTNGKVSFPGSGGPRDVLGADRTYYVRTDGSDSNDGLTDSAGGAFLTIQKAVDAVADLDVNGKTVTIQIRDGTYSGPVTLKNVVGFAKTGDLAITGNAATPANVVVSSSNNHGFLADGLSTRWDITNLKIATTTHGSSIYATNGSYVRYGGIEFGVCANYNVLADNRAFAVCIGDVTVSAGTQGHLRATFGATIFCIGVTQTFVATPNFSVAYATADYGCSLIANSGGSFVGGATGQRYQASLNSVIYTGGNGPTYFPGNAAGSLSSGGQYN